MQLLDRTPDILGAWGQFVQAHEMLAIETGSEAPLPLELLVSFAGALVAELAGGVVDPRSGGTLIALDDGTTVLVAITSDDRGQDFGLVVDPTSCRADRIALVAFAGGRPVAIHILEARRLAALRDALGVPAPLPPKAPTSALVLTTLFHWNLCMEPLTAELHGVQTRWLVPGTVSSPRNQLSLLETEEPAAEEVA